MNRFQVTTDRPYEVIVGSDLLSQVGAFLLEMHEPCKVCVITDSTVNELYASRVLESLDESGFVPSKIVFPAGEHSKNLSTYGNVLESLAEDGLSRSDLILALGGGVVGDLAGFAAATYLRGIDCIQVPTTYLAAVDSSLGGKTGVNLLYGKNLAGAFWQPSLVVCDHSTFQTLPEEEMREGVAEAIKSGMLMEKALVDKVVDRDYESVIPRCLSIKKSIVEADERDTGMRQLLNFGHTVAHSLERLSNYHIPHGTAVAKGMVAESRGAYKMGLTDFDASEYLREALGGFGFDLSIPYSSNDLYTYAMNDKKISGSTIALTVPEAVGKCRLQKISLSELEPFLDLCTK